MTDDPLGDPVPEPWPDLLPIEGPPLPELDLDGVPDPLAKMVEATSRALEVPPELPFALGITAVSALLIGRVVIEVDDGWVERPGLYTATILDPAERKTPALRLMTGVLDEYQARRVAEEEAAIAQRRSERQVIEREVEQARRYVAKARDQERGQRGDQKTQKLFDRVAEEEHLAQLVRRLVEFPEPVEFCLLTEDATPEALILYLNEHGRIAVLSDEGGLFDVLAGRYSNSGAANLDVVLTGYTGGPVRGRRVGSDGVGRRWQIPDVSMALGFAVQPDVLAAVMENRQMVRRGFAQRFLFLLPAGRVGRRRGDTKAVPESVQRAWRSRLIELAGTPDSPPYPPEPGPEGGSGGYGGESQGSHAVSLSSGAREVVRSLAAVTEARMTPEGDLFAIRGWGGKLVGTLCRVAAAFHFIRHGVGGVGEPVDERDMTTAAGLADLFAAHARRAFRLPDSGRLPVADVRRVTRWIERRPEVQVFTARDVFQDVHNPDGAFPQIDELTPVLRRLADHGWIRELPDSRPAGTPGRPPSPRYQVNPKIHAERTGD